MAVQESVFILGAAGAVVGIATAIFVMTSGQSTKLNRRLVATLLSLAVYIGGTSTTALLDFAGVISRQTFFALVVTFETMGFLLFPLYLLFVGEAIQIKFTAWIRWRPVDILLHAIIPVVMVMGYLSITTGAIVWIVIIRFMLLAMALYGLAAAIMYVRATPASPQDRSRAWDYFIAFASHDASLIVLLVANMFAQAGLVTIDAIGLQAMHLLGAGLLAAFFVLLARATLRGRIIDAARKKHRGIRRGTVAAVFIAVFVAVQTLVGEFVTATVGLVAGAVASGLLFFALNPLQRWAERIANRAVPEAAVSGLRASQKEEFYREQVEIAYLDGLVGPKDRRALRNIRTRLGISATVALRIEDSVAG